VKEYISKNDKENQEKLDKLIKEKVDFETDFKKQLEIILTQKCELETKIKELTMRLEKKDSELE
jgi:hypothetical protein